MQYWFKQLVLCNEIPLTSAGIDTSHCHDHYYHKTVQVHALLSMTKKHMILDRFSFLSN